MNDVFARPSRAKTLLAMMVLAAMACAVHWPAVHDGGIWDDNHYVTENPTLRDPGGLWDIWNIRGMKETKLMNYFPLLFTTWWIEYRLTGLDMTIGHAINVLLHALSALILWRFLKRLSVGGAWIAAALFAVHPVTVESVAWLSERKNTLSMPLFLLSMLLFLRFEGSGAAAADADGGGDPTAGSAPNKRGPAGFLPSFLGSRPVTYAASLLLFVLALLAKTSVVTLPVLLLVFAWWRYGRVRPKDLLHAAPFFAVALLLGLATMYHEWNVGQLGVAARYEGFWSRLAASGWCVWFYLYKLVLPWGLSMVYPRWNVDPASAVAWLPLLGLLALAVAAWCWRTGWGRPVLAALGVYVALLLPVLGFLDIGYFGHSLVSDHFQYASMWSPLALAAAAGFRLFRGSNRTTVSGTGIAIAAVVLAALSSLTWARAALYESPEALWRDALGKNPNSWIVHTRLGSALTGQGRFKEAIERFREALELHQDNYDAHHNLGIALAELDRHGEAIEPFRAAVACNPTQYEGHFHLALTLQIQGHHEEAIAEYLETLALKPDHANANYNLGLLILAQGRHLDALVHFRRALEFGLTDAATHHNLADCLVVVGRSDDAIVHYLHSIRLAPDDVETRGKVAAVMVSRGEHDQAIEHLVAALRVAPRSALLHLGLADAHAAAGRLDEAIAAAKRALELAVAVLDGHGAPAEQIRARIARFEQERRVGPR